MQAFGCNQTPCRPSRGVVSSEPQPFLPCLESAPKTQRVMVVAPQDHLSDWLGVMRLPRRRVSTLGRLNARVKFRLRTRQRPSPGLALELLLNLRRTYRLRLYAFSVSKRGFFRDLDLEDLNGVPEVLQTHIPQRSQRKRSPYSSAGLGVDQNLAGPGIVR
jgi:hypothetical protein